MPRLSQLLTPGEAHPAQTGLPRGTVDVPAVPLPQVPGNFAQAVPQAASALGGQISETGQALAADQRRFDLLAARVQQAEAKTAALKARNTYTAELDTFAATQKLEGDPSTYPQRLRDFDTQLRGRLSKDLGPLARDAFEVEAGERFSTVNREAEHYRVTSTLKSGEVAVDEAQAQYIRGVVGNANPEDVSQRTVSFLKTLQDFEALGVLPRGAGATRFRTAQEQIQDEEVDRYTAVEPGRMLDHLTALQRGQPGDANLPTPSPLKLADKIQKAQTEVDQQIQAQERRTVQAEKTVKEGRERTEITLTNRLINTTNLNELTALQRDIERLALDRTANGLGREGQDRMLSALNAQRQRIESGIAGGVRQTSDPTRLRTWEIITFEKAGERTPAQLQEFTVKALQDPALTPADATRIAQGFQRELDASHVSKLHGYSAALDRLNAGFRTVSIFGFDEEAQRQEIAARQLFTDRVEAVVQEKGRKAAEQSIRTIEDQILLDFSKSLLSKVRDELEKPHPLPPGVYRSNPDLESMNDTDIDQRYTDGVVNLREGVRNGDLSPAQFASYLDMVTQRHKWEMAYWQGLRKEGKGKPSAADLAKPPGQPGFFQRWNPFGGSSPTPAPPTQPTQPTPAQATDQFRDAVNQGLKGAR